MKGKAHKRGDGQTNKTQQNTNFPNKPSTVSALKAHGCKEPQKIGEQILKRSKNVERRKKRREKVREYEKKRKRNINERKKIEEKPCIKRKKKDKITYQRIYKSEGSYGKKTSLHKREDKMK